MVRFGGRGSGGGYPSDNYRIVSSNRFFRVKYMIEVGPKCDTAQDEESDQFNL